MSISEIEERIANAKVEAQKAYIEACKEFNRPHKISWAAHYESKPALARDMEFLVAEYYRVQNLCPACGHALYEHQYKYKACNCGCEYLHP